MPAGDLVDLCYSGRYTHEQALHLIVWPAGLVALAGTNSVSELDKRAAAGDSDAAKAIELMSFTIVKNIGQMAAVLCGDVDAVILTGGIANCRRVTDYITRHCRFIAPIEIFPGENELQALAHNALRVLQRQTEAKIYE